MNKNKLQNIGRQMNNKMKDIGTKMNNKTSDIINRYSSKINDLDFSKDNVKNKLNNALNISMFLSANWLIVCFLVVVILVYFYYFHNRRIRLFNTAIMIPLEPENQDYCQKISNMFYRYLYNKNNLLDYGDTISGKLYFFDKIESEIKVYNKPMIKKCKKTRGDDKFTMNIINFKDKIEEIQSNVFKDESFKEEEFFKEFENIDKDKYIEGVEKLINTNFNWSPASKFIKNDKNKEKITDFFEKDLVYLSKEELKDVYNEYMENNCIFNFVDLENIELNDINQLSNNKLIERYGQYMETPLMEIITEIKGRYPDNEKVEEFITRNNNNDFYTTTKTSPPIPELVDELVKELKEVFFDFYGIDEVFYKHFLGIEDSLDIKEIRCSKDPTKEKDFDNDDEKLAFKNNMDILKIIEDFKDNYDTEYERFLTDYYLLIERVVYTTFNTKDNNNVFTERQQRSIINIYQNIVDFVYLKTNKGDIEDSIKFTVHHILNTDSKKDEKLDNLLELYIAIDEFFILGGKYKAKLEDYNLKRKPDISQLTGLYKCNFDNIYNYFIQKGIFNQWKQYFSGQRPTRYSWIFGKFVDDFDETYKGLYKSLEPFVEHFNTEQKTTKTKEGFQGGKRRVIRPDKKEVVEHFGGGYATAAAIAAGVAVIVAAFYFFFDLIKLIPKIFIMLVKALKNITNPFEIIELLGKFALLVLFTIFKLLMFTIRLPSDGMYLFGEYILYLLVLVPFTVFNVGAYLLLSALNGLFMVLDKVTGGLFYRTIYWLVGATENAPASWYLTPGHHYGYDSCNKSAESESTECHNSYENKAKRMFFAYYPCGNSYKPDRTSKGFTCSRKYDQEPSYCLQANIYRLKNNLNVLTPIVPDRFVPSLEYLKATKAKRRDLHKKYKQMKVNFYNNCTEGMYDYDGLTKNICKLYPSIVNEGDRNKMETLCYNAYCVNGSREPFCYRMTKSHTFMNQRNKSVIPRIFVITLYIIVLAFIINVMLANDPS